MAVIRLFGDPALKRRALGVARMDDSVRGLAREMFATLKAKRGVGLAANQVGATIRVIVVDPTAGDDEDAAFAMVNPVITRRTGTFTDEEGCLSFPGLRLEIPRAMEVRVEGMDLNGNPMAIDAAGLLARIFQHEIDHLDAVLIVNRLPFLDRLRLFFRLRRLRREYRQLQRQEAPPREDAES
jgi:peptide deformylase